MGGLAIAVSMAASMVITGCSGSVSVRGDQLIGDAEAGSPSTDAGEGGDSGSKRDGLDAGMDGGGRPARNRDAGSNAGPDGSADAGTLDAGDAHADADAEADPVPAEPCPDTACAESACAIDSVCRRVPAGRRYVEDDGSYVISRPAGLAGVVDLMARFLPNTRLFAVVVDDLLGTGEDEDIGLTYGAVDRQGGDWLYQFPQDRLGRMRVHPDTSRDDDSSWISDPFEYSLLVRLPIIGESEMIAHDAVMELGLNADLTRVDRADALAVIDQPQLQAMAIDTTLLPLLVACTDLCPAVWCTVSTYPSNADQVMSCNGVSPDTTWNDPDAGAVPAYTMQFAFTASEANVLFRD